MRETLSDTARRGQSRGQGQRLAAVAAQHGVSPRWLRLVAYGSLDDRAFVQALRQATAPALWELVAPTALEALVPPTVKMEHLGGSRDDLLVMLLEALDTLAHPRNRNFARQTSPLELVNQRLDEAIESRSYNRLVGISANAGTAGRASAAKKRENSPARKWLQEVESRKHGSKEQKYRVIADRKGLKPGSVKKAVLRISKEK